MPFERLKAATFGKFALYTSTLSYIAWALFGVIYFGIQAGFEEFMLRRIAAGKSV